jgi:hypothetical protein
MKTILAPTLMSEVSTRGGVSLHFRVGRLIGAILLMGIGTGIAKIRPRS